MHWKRILAPPYTLRLSPIACAQYVYHTNIDLSTKFQSTTRPTHRVTTMGPHTHTHTHFFAEQSAQRADTLLHRSHRRHKSVQHLEIRVITNFHPLTFCFHRVTGTTLELWLTSLVMHGTCASDSQREHDKAANSPVKIHIHIPEALATIFTGLSTTGRELVTNLSEGMIRNDDGLLKIRQPWNAQRRPETSLRSHPNESRRRSQWRISFGFHEYWCSDFFKMCYFTKQTQITCFFFM